jgi:hypothetical protein
MFATIAPHTIEEAHAPVSSSASSNLLHQSGSDREKRGFFASEAKSRKTMIRPAVQAYLWVHDSPKVQDGKYAGSV